MSALTALLLLFSSSILHAAEPTNSLPSEPVLQDKPLSFWLESLAKWDTHAADASKAVQAAGLATVPSILRFTIRRSDGSTNQSDTGRAVARACRALDNNKPNRALEKLLRNGLRDTNSQVRINAIAGLPLDQKFKSDLEKLAKDPDLQVRRAATNALTHLTRYHDWLKKQSATPAPPPAAAPRKEPARRR